MPNSSDVDNTTRPTPQQPSRETGLILPGNLDALDSLARYVVQVATEAGLSRKAVYRLRLAVDEIVTNSVTHGYQDNNLDGQIEIWARIDETALTIVVEDTAPAYDPDLDRATTILKLPVEDRPIGGLGVFLAVHNVDEFTYERLGDCNRHTFVVKRPGEGS